jgi:uncharacterized protein YbbC (DUF1343 family)
MKILFHFLRWPLAGLLLVAVACAPPFKQVTPGADVLIHEKLELIRGKRVGIITNQTALTRDGRHIVDVLAGLPDVRITALFAPEHGIRGDRPGGEWIPSYTDSVTGITVFSLYGKTRKPTPEMLDSVDVLLFDIQDIGARFYTYISTMGLAMEAAAEKGIPFIVLDRPNPISGAIVEGPVLKPRWKSFVGMFPIPIRHGMTVGELALMINGEGWLAGGIKADLTVIAARDWNRLQWFDQTGLGWVKTSPNIPDLQSAMLYPGIALLEGVNVSEGRGTQAPFQIIGAPWFEPERIKKELPVYWTYGLRIEPTEFVPEPVPGAAPHPEYEGETCRGFRLEIHDRNVFRPVSFAIYLLCALQKLYPDRLKFTPGFDRLTGDERIREQILAGEKPEKIIAGWKRELNEFKAKRRRYLLYP